MFERFTAPARRVVVLAQEEARRLNHDYIGTEHLLLGLLHEGQGVASLALETLGISVESVRSQVDEIVGMGRSLSPAHIPFTAPAKKVLELSLAEAVDLGHPLIGTEHILLALMRAGNDLAAEVLVNLGVDLPHARDRVLQLLQERSGQGDEPVMKMESLTLGFRSAGTGVRVPPDPSSMPLCPACSEPLRGNLRTAKLPLLGEEGVPVSSGFLFVVYCTRCGVAIETKIDEGRP